MFKKELRDMMLPVERAFVGVSLKTVFRDIRMWYRFGLLPQTKAE